MPYRTSENLIDGLILTFVDIDHVKRAEDTGKLAMEQLDTETEERWRAEGQLRRLSRVFQEAAVSMILEDRHGAITDLNAEAERVYGWSREELIGQSVKTLVAAESHGQIDDLLDRCCRDENLRHVATMHQTKSGEVMRVFINVSPLTDDQGAITGFVTIATPGVAPEDATTS
jgi:PAS domain S-box-containing protein